MKNRRIIRKTKYCLLWAGLSILIWFANCDATYRMELVNRMVNWLFFGNGYETQTENMETVSASGEISGGYAAGILSGRRTGTGKWTEGSDCVGGTDDG